MPRLARADYPLRFTPTFKNMAGSQMLAAVITTMFFGIAIFMVMRYLIKHSRNDPLPIKILVCTLGILATLEAAFTDHWMYQYFILDQDNREHRDVIYFSIPGKTMCIFLVAFFSQLFYASRIWRVGSLFESPVRWSVVPIIALALLQLGGGLIQIVVMIETKRFSVFNERVWDTIRSMYIHGAAAAACDILITIALVVILRSTGVNATRRTKSLLEKLVLYAINRGVVTSTLALLSILLYDLASGSLYYLIPFSSNTQIYVISVVSMLNSREGLREAMDRSFHVSDLMMTTQKSGGTGTDRSSSDALNDQNGTVDSKAGTRLRDESMNC